jgi:predicted dehydrogenase
MGIYVLEHGVHALVEKPVGVYARQARELIDVAATKPEFTFGVFFNQRTNPLYQDLMALPGVGRARRPTAHLLDRHHVVAAAGLLHQSDWRATWAARAAGSW